MPVTEVSLHDNFFKDWFIKKTTRLDLCSIWGWAKIFLAVLSNKCEITFMAFVHNLVGLCKNCRHHREIKNARGSVFYLCALAASDSRFPKYPRLPVLQCEGYVPRAPKSEPTPDA